MWLKYLLIALEAYAAIMQVARVGQRREVVVTAREAAWTVAMAALLIWGIATYWR